jgi:phosphoglycerate dehydrogenase-like enzyme
LEILLLERLVPEAQAWLEARHQVEVRPELAQDPTALRRALYNVQALVVPRKVPVTRELLDFAPVLRVAARIHGGSDDVDLEACRERRVRVIQASSAHVRSNAEYLLASLLLLYRRGVGDSLKGDRHAPPSMGRELHGSTVGLLGIAPTAHPLALMLGALGAKLIGYDPAVHHTAPIWQRLGIQPVSLQELMVQSDAVSVQVLYGSRYQHFVNDKVLAYCRKGQVWVGVTRSAFFEPHALAAALSDGRIEAALLDGAESGFARRGTPLHDKQNLFLTPRVGSMTRESRLRACWYVAQRLHDALTAPRPTNSGFDQLSSAPMGLGAESDFAFLR